MTRTRWLLASLLLVLASSTGTAAPVPMPTSKLIDAPVYGMLRPHAAYEVVKLWQTLFASTAYGKAVYQRIAAKLKRELKFDPTSPKGLRQIGIDPSAVAWGAFGAVDPRSIEATHRNIAQGLKSKSGKQKLEPPPAFVRVRLVLPLSDAARFRGYLGKLFSLLKPDKAAVAGQISRHVDGDAAKTGLADALIKHRVVVFARPDRDALVFLRIMGNNALLDLVQSWWKLPSKLNSDAIKRAVAALAAPTMPAAKMSSALHRMAFAAQPKPGAALYVSAKPLLRLSLLAEKRRLLQIQLFAGRSSRSSGDYWKMSLARARKCQQAWKKVRWMSGDVAVRATLNKRSWHTKAWWRAPRKLLRLIKAGVLSQDELIDPTAYKATIALGGSNLDLGRVAGKLARGVFGQRLHPFVSRMVQPCEALSTSTLATGGWVGLLGVGLTEAKAEMLSPVLAKIRNGVGLLRSLPKMRRFGRFKVKQPGSAMAHFVFSNSSKVRAHVMSLAAKASLKPSTQTISGRRTMMLPPNRHWQNMALALSEMKQRQVGLTLGATANDVRWFVSQKRPTSAIFPPSIVAFGHVNLPALLSHYTSTLSGIQGRMMGTMFKALADKVGNLKGNISLERNSLSAELRLDRK